MIESSEFVQRRQRVVEQLNQFRADAFLTLALPNVRYLSNFTGSNGAVLVSQERACLFTDPRYQTQAPLETDCEVKIAKDSLLIEVAKWAKRVRLRSILFEQNRITFSSHGQLSASLSGIRLKPAIELVEQLRMIKSPSEISAIRSSVQLNSKALDEALRSFSPAMSEIELAAEIEYRMRGLGADGPAFDTIVAADPRSALPHAHPTREAIRRNRLLLIDMGSNVSGYASDMTRTYAVGKLDPRRKRLYRAVLESQLAAIEAIKPGVSCSNVDRAARDVLHGYGLDEKFIHSTGHGLGLEIHESPRVGRKERTKLETGMVITVEPGVYEGGVGGVRIEDTVVVTGSGCEILTPTPKDLVVL